MKECVREEWRCVVKLATDTLSDDDYSVKSDTDKQEDGVRQDCTENWLDTSSIATIFSHPATTADELEEGGEECVPVTLAHEVC